ncbi:M20/M25/M40 family metallo-hydrolase [bacterium]|nr:M20/M25/M40 family metallo-hydrolase [bacterium]
MIASYIKSIREQFEDQLKKLVEIPTVSADPKHRKDIHHAAKIAKSFLHQAGAKAEIVQTSGNPIVIGSFDVSGAKRDVTIYNHLDVQPADEPEWKHDPFTFRKQNDKYFGRGTTDDKGPALTALFAAQYAAKIRIPINIRFVWELEEEIGSPNFEEFLRKNKKNLKCDSVVVIDSVWISANRPCVYYALRGNITGSMILETADRAVHSGIAGGVAVNPLFELCRVAARCYDPRSGRVLVPGFYEGVIEPGAAEYANFRKSGFDLQKWAQSYGLKKLQVKNRNKAIQRLWCRPTFEVHGVVGGYTGPGVKTAIAGKAELKFSCRLAPNQNPKQISKRFREYIRKLNPAVKVRFHAAISPYLGTFKANYSRAASNAFLHGFGKRPVFARVGGSDGAIISLHKHLKAHINLMGLSLPQHGYHAPNEYFEWPQAQNGIKTFVKYFEEVAKF